MVPQLAENQGPAGSEHFSMALVENRMRLTPGALELFRLLVDETGSRYKDLIKCEAKSCDANIVSEPI